MASSASTDTISEEERRWLVIGLCLNKVIAPALRKVFRSELPKWYNILCQPPLEIHKPVRRKTLPSSTFSLNYKSINNNEKKPSHTYDFAVKDPLSLAKLFMQPHMAKCTGFNDTMDMSAILAVMCNATPFSSAAADAKIVRDIRNKWAHCNFSEWIQPVFTASIKALISFIKTSNLPKPDEKAVFDDLDYWEKKVSQLCLEEPVNSELLKLVTEEVAELRKSVETCDTKMSEVLDNFGKKLRDMLCRTEKLEELAAENAKGVERNWEELQRHSEKFELLDKKRTTEDHVFQEFSDKKVPYGLRSLPRDMVERPSEVNEILCLLMQGNNYRVGVAGSRSGDVFGIRGMGGLGKTVLALAVAWASSKSRHVIWFDIGETPDRLRLINILIKVLGGDVSFSDISAAQAWVKVNTSDKDCLVVLDDVWSVDDAHVFDHLSGKCQLLITTRDADVVRGLRGSALYELQIMADDKSRTLLYQTAQVTPDIVSKFSSNMKRIVAELLDQCRGLPLALSLVGSNLIDTREENWQNILDDLKNADLEELPSLFPTDVYPYGNLIAAINVSFKRLGKFEQEGLEKCEKERMEKYKQEIQQKFLDFAIFPEDINIPLDILDLFWSSEESGRSSCSPRKARRILEVLERKSMIQKGPEFKGKTASYRVHDLLLDFARAKLRGTLTDVHRVFVKTLRGQCVDGEWTTTSSISQKDYYFKYLPYHLHASEQHSELLQLFFDFHWLQQKVKETDLPSLISDFRFLDTSTQEIKLLKKSLMLSADAIKKNPNSIGPQLLGRLLSCVDNCPGVKKLLECVRDTHGKTFHLLPLFSCLKLEGPEIFKKTGYSVWSLATSNISTGTIVISGLYKGSIHIHELETGKELQVLQGHTRIVQCLALSHSGTAFASGSEDGTTRLWNVESFEQLLVLPGERGNVVIALDFSTDDQRLFTGSADGKLRVWRVATGELLHVIPAHDDFIRGLCTTKDGLYIATASDDHTIKLWKAETLNIDATLIGHTHAVNSVVAAGNDNPMLVSASNDGTLKIWDVKKHQEIRTLSSHKGGVTCVAVSPDTRHIISGGDRNDMIVKLWCFRTGELLSCFEGHTSDICCVSITSDGSKALSCSRDASFRVWDLDISAHLRQDMSRGHSDRVTDIAVTRDGLRCVSTSADSSFRIWKCDTAESKECFTFRGLKRKGVNVAISPDDRHVVSVSKDSSSSWIKVWNLLDGSEITGIELDNKAKLVRFSLDGRLVIIGCYDRHSYISSKVSIWDWQKNDVKCVTLPSFRKTTEITCDGNMIYTCSRKMEVCQIDLRSLKVSNIRRGPYPNCTPMVVLPDGKAILSGKLGDSSFIFWELSTDKQFTCNADHSDDSMVTAIDITLNGKLALTGSSSGTLSLMNLDSFEVVQTPGKTEAGVGIRLVCILSDQARFVFVDMANRVELRNFNNKDAELLLDQPAVKVTCITTHGVDYVLLGCENGELVLFNLHVKQYKYKYQAHSEAVSQVKSDPAGVIHFFVSGSASGCVKLWYVSKTVPPLSSQIWSHDNVYPHSITALAFVPHSEDIVIGSFDNKVYRINAAGIVGAYRFDGRGIAALHVVEDSLVGAGWDYDRIRFVKWSLNEVLKTSFIEDGPYYEGRRINNASNHTATTVGDSLLIWNFQTGATLCKVLGHTQYPSPFFRISALAFVPGGEFILTGQRIYNTLKLWNLRNGRFVEEFHFDQRVEAIACASNGIVCVGLNDGQVCFLRFNNLSSQSGQLDL